MRCLLIFSIVLSAVTGLGQETDKQSYDVWFAGEKACIAFRDTTCTAFVDTVGISKGDDFTVIVRYSYEDHDSVKCFWLHELDGLQGKDRLRGEDYFREFVAPFFTLTFIYSIMINQTLTDAGNFEKFPNYVSSNHNRVDSVWVNVDGVTINALAPLNPQSIGRLHDAVTEFRANTFQYPEIDSLLKRYNSTDNLPTWGWMVFSFRTIP